MKLRVLAHSPQAIRASLAGIVTPVNLRRTPEKRTTCQRERYPQHVWHYADVEWEKALGFTVIGALVTTVGTLLGLVLKERVFVRSFERWRAALALVDVARRYREPIALSALELCNRLVLIIDEYPTDFLLTSVMNGVAPERPNLVAAADPYVRRYRHVSSVYRLCAFLGWVELYRQDTTYLEPNEKTRTRAVEKAIFAIRADLADDDFVRLDDWTGWHDSVIFREEQRAIGESMIVALGNIRSVMGYAEFADSYPGARQTSRSRWVAKGGEFLCDLHAPPRAVGVLTRLVHSNCGFGEVSNRSAMDACPKSGRIAWDVVRMAAPRSAGKASVGGGVRHALLCEGSRRPR
jgi:hypothetical protein